MGNFARYLPHTPEDIRRMLETIGVKRVEDLFETIPAKYRLSKSMNLLSPGEPVFSAISRNSSHLFYLFLGGELIVISFQPLSLPISRSEFYTAYTPYQPEISQGTLQSIFEYQTLMCQLTGMEVSNGSLYDGASSLAEAVLMAFRITKRKKILLSQAIHTEYRKVIETYIDPDQQEIILIPYRKGDGRTDEKPFDLLDETVNAVVIQSPNFLAS
jgi:glycine dehydrogenase subunit 1